MSETSPKPPVFATLGLSAVQNRSVDLVRTFQWVPQTSVAVALDVTLKYRAKQAMDEAVEKEKTRVVGKAAYNQLADLGQMEADLQEFSRRVLLESIVKASPCTFATIAALVPVSEDQIKAGGGLDAKVWLDPTTAPPTTPTIPMAPPKRTSRKSSRRPI